ncbi:hypothetical protein DERF_002967 [Dermatophagoides farinae]|uniref:Uncharacterized protein n=1 Tax=Dermatophagoides farinae TaxID=6954 RepID=A0A922LB40_DERFA|nr:hypothetical protein DERF_002967 [Dermatophagoides farinae]
MFDFEIRTFSILYPSIIQIPDLVVVFHQGTFLLLITVYNHHQADALEYSRENQLLCSRFYQHHFHSKTSKTEY